MAQGIEPHRTPATELWASSLFDGKPMPLVLAPGTASGFKRVIKVDNNTYAARRTVGGKLQHLWSSDDPRECAYVLARLELEPCSVEDIKKACKEAAKERNKHRVIKRKIDQLLDEFAVWRVPRGGT